MPTEGTEETPKASGANLSDLRRYKLRGHDVEYVSEPLSHSVPVFAAETDDSKVLIGNIATIAPVFKKIVSLCVILFTDTGYVSGVVRWRYRSIAKLSQLSIRDLIKVIKSSKDSPLMQITLRHGSYDLFFSRVTALKEENWTLLPRTTKEHTSDVPPVLNNPTTIGSLKKEGHQAPKSKEEKVANLTGKQKTVRALLRTGLEAAGLTLLLGTLLMIGVSAWKPMALIALVLSGGFAVYYAKKSTEKPNVSRER